MKEKEVLLVFGSSYEVELGIIGSVNALNLQEREGRMLQTLSTLVSQMDSLGVQSNGFRHDLLTQEKGRVLRG
jgi:hypothetical protein